MALLAGKTAVITGGSSGIGLATARRFVQEGATIFIFSPRPAELDAAVATLGTAATAFDCVSNSARLLSTAPGIGEAVSVWLTAVSPVAVPFPFVVGDEPTEGEDER